MAVENRQSLEFRQERAVAALERIQHRVKGRFSHELRVTSTSYDDIFGSVRWCCLNEVVPVTELNWFWRLIDRLFPGDWLEPVVSIRIDYPHLRVINDAHRFDLIVAQEMHQLASEIGADGIVRSL